MSDPNSTSPDILSGPGKDILRPDICLSSGNTHMVTFIETIIVGNSWKINALSRLVIFWVLIFGFESGVLAGAHA
jgi:hypothetical protein